MFKLNKNCSITSHLTSNKTIIMTSDPKARRIAQIVRLKPAHVQAYITCHNKVWPGVLQQITECKIVDYSISLDRTPVQMTINGRTEECYTLFASMKYVGDDWEGDMAKMQANEEVRRWWKMTDGMQVSLVDGSSGSTDAKGWRLELEEVFRNE